MTVFFVTLHCFERTQTAQLAFNSDAQFVLSAEGAHNSISEKTDPKFSFLASDTWGDWGALVSFSKAERNNRTDSNSGINFRPMGRFLEASAPRSTQAAAVLERDAGVIVSDFKDKDETKTELKKVMLLNNLRRRA